MKNLVMAIFGLLRCVALFAADCPRQRLELETESGVVIDDVLWRSYWLGGRDSTIAASPLTLLGMDGNVGYCSQIAALCRAYAVDLKKGVVHIAEERPYEHWTKGQWPRFSKSAESCDVNLVSIGWEAPSAVRNRSRAQSGRQIAKSIRSQGLTAKGSVVTIPHYSDLDRQVFICLREKSGKMTVLTMMNKGQDWWAFYSFESGGSYLAEMEVRDKILRNELMDLH